MAAPSRAQSTLRTGPPRSPSEKDWGPLLKSSLSSLLRSHRKADLFPEVRFSQLTAIMLQLAKSSAKKKKTLQRTPQVPGLRLPKKQISTEACRCGRVAAWQRWMPRLTLPLSCAHYTVNCTFQNDNRIFKTKHLVEYSHSSKEKGQI